MRDYLLDAGLPARVVVADPAGVTTSATCRNAEAFLEERNLETAAVVTQYFHVARARWSCEQAGIDIAGAEAAEYFELRDLYALVRESVAFPAYVVRAAF